MPSNSRKAVHTHAPSIAYFVDLEPSQDDFLGDVLKGLSESQKVLAPKYFYDERGSQIFDDICRCEEYYVTRTEMALLKSIGRELRLLAGPHASIIEYGSGSSWKIRTLLDALDEPKDYVAIDISRDHLLVSAEEIASSYADLSVGAICADFTKPFAMPDEAVKDAQRKVGFFPGSTIGNLTPDDAAAFLRSAHGHLAPGGALLIGVDLIKDETVLNAAYNDKAGHTRAFNLNLLHRMKAELGAEVNPDDFEHLAFFNREKSRIEMHLKAIRDLTISVGGKTFSMTAGETIHTENSHKYSVDGFQAIARTAGFVPHCTWSDPDGLFSLHWLRTE